MNENRNYCKRIADELDDYASGNVRRCPNCDATHTREWDEVGDKFECPHCGDVDSLDEWEPLSLYDYLESEVLDITWIINSDRTFHSARFYVTLGGPSCWIDTEHNTVELRWGGESACYGLLSDTADAVEDFAAELWEMGGG